MFVTSWTLGPCPQAAEGNIRERLLYHLSRNVYASFSAFCLLSSVLSPPDEVIRAGLQICGNTLLTFANMSDTSALAAAATKSKMDSPRGDKKKSRHERSQTHKDKHSKSHRHRHERGEQANSATAGTAGVGPAEDWEANRAHVEELSATPPNNICADCGETGTRWASVNLGLFICIRCSGVHRSLGVHISKVKSTNMDGWTAAEVDLMASLGNSTGKSLYESKVPPDTRVPHPGMDDVELRDFLERKYVAREFAADNVNSTLRKVYRRVGYGMKPNTCEVEQPSWDDGGAAEAPMSKATRDATVRALYGDTIITSAAATRPPQRTRSTHGVFGAVTVDANEYEVRLAAVLKYFGEAPLPSTPPGV